MPTGKKYIRGTGRRKSAIARVRIRAGEGLYQINGRDVDRYFTEEKDRKAVMSPLEAVGMMGNVDVLVSVHGGGFSGQAGAIVLGLGRALTQADTSLEATLRAAGFLTRDPRMRERKKYGQRGARRRFQFSKR